MKGIFYISVNNFVKKYSKQIWKQQKKLENKYVIFKTNMKKHIYENDHFSYVHEKKSLHIWFFHEFVFNISFLLLFTKLFIMT
jgi:hypothetical protein